MRLLDRFFAALDGLLRVGPPLTNVNDFRTVLVQDRQGEGDDR